MIILNSHNTPILTQRFALQSVSQGTHTHTPILRHHSENIHEITKVCPILQILKKLLPRSSTGRASNMHHHHQQQLYHKVSFLSQSSLKYLPFLQGVSVSKSSLEREKYTRLKVCLPEFASVCQQERGEPATDGERMEGGAFFGGRGFNMCVI